MVYDLKLFQLWYNNEIKLKSYRTQYECPYIRFITDNMINKKKQVKNRAWIISLIYNI